MRVRKTRPQPDGSKYTKPSLGDRMRKTRRRRTGGRSVKTGRRK